MRPEAIILYSDSVDAGSPCCGRGLKSTSMMSAHEGSVDRGPIAKSADWLNPTIASIDDLRRTWGRRLFEPCIHHIRFPMFKNLEENLKVEFSFPITVLVGANGSNKSSILRALQGCPEGENISTYWFGTPLDSVPDDERHRFIHGRWSDSAGKVVEVVQVRRARSSSRTGQSRPDYFESDAPFDRDGMEPMPPYEGDLPADRRETRWRAIQKNVVYFDFRAEISAFDKYFHHNDFNTRGPIVRQFQQIRDRKETLFEKSTLLRKILDRGAVSYKPGGKELVIRPPRYLDQAELDWVSYILGRRYVKIQVVGHRAFKVSGTTALMETEHLKYSEAWAGSGEFAVVQLVTVVLDCPERTLLLLDEPEVSLHPGAQSRLVDFLRQLAMIKKLQVVMSTHSPTIVHDLPADAIKVLDANSDGKMMLRAQESLPSEAFFALQHHFHKKTIMVEDRLAREIINVILRLGGEAKFRSVDVKFFPGGASLMRSRLVPLLALEGRRDVLIILDGDQSFSLPPAATMIAEDSLAEAVLDILGVKKVDGYVPADSGGAKVDDLRKIIDWSRQYITFLPGREPDLWLANVIDPKATVVGNGKSWWDDRCRSSSAMLASERVTSDQRFRYQQFYLGELRDDPPADLLALGAEIDRFLG